MIKWMFMVHILTDFVMQSDFIANTKGRHPYILFVHSALSGLGMGLFFKVIGVYADWKVYVIIATHFVIDYLKANARDKTKAMSTYLYLDQIAHLVINLILMKVGA